MKAALRRHQHLVRTGIVFFAYAVTAFCVLHMFMLSFGWFRELRFEGFSFDRMVTFTADRPFAYRVLMPMLVNAGASLFPHDFMRAYGQWLIESSPLLYYSKNQLFRYESMALKVHLEYVYLYVSLICLLYSVRYLTKRVYPFPGVFSDAVPAIALVCLPLVFTQGGHIYDYPELLLSALCLICIIKKKWLLYYTMFVLAILNKEVNVLLILFFIALCRDAMAKKDLLKHIVLHLIIGTALVLLVRYVFADNPQIPDLNNYWKHNIRFWLNPASYVLFWDPYHIGLPIFPRASNVIFIAVTAFFVFYKWHDKPLQIKRLFIYTAIFNIPLFLYGGWEDEIRALSLLFPAVYFLSVYTLYRLIYPNCSLEEKII